MIYDKIIVAKYRQKAIIDASQLIAKNIYWSNYHGKSFKFIKLLSKKEAYKFKNISVETNDETISWMLIEINGGLKAESLRDNNIGDSYNPWLIFDNEQDMKDYINELMIIY